MADAVTTGSRSPGMDTPVATPMRAVPSAMRATAIHVSPYAAGDSNTHTRWYPSSSANRASSTAPALGGIAHEIIGLLRGVCQDKRPDIRTPVLNRQRAAVRCPP